MLRGSHRVQVDDKGRLKIPVPFFQYLSQKFGLDVFVTSTTGDYVRVYPMGVWEELEKRFKKIPDSLPAKRKVWRTLNYFGQASSLDKQGRLVIHPPLRDRAQTMGEVSVLGQTNFLEIWNTKRFEEMNPPPTPEEEYRLADAYKI